MGFWSHTKAILWKEWLIWKRNKKTTACVFILPVYLMMILVIIRLVISTEYMEPTAYPEEYLNTAQSLRPDLENKEMSKVLHLNNAIQQWFFNMTIAQQRIGIIKGEKMSDKFLQLAHLYNVSGLIKKFDSLDDLKDYAENPSEKNKNNNELITLPYGFHFTTSEKGNYAYELLVDKTKFMIVSDNYINTFSQGPRETEYNNIRESGAQFLQYMLDSLILDEEAGKSFDVIQVPMKTGKYKNDQMSVLIGIMIPWFFILASMIPQQIVFGRIMTEKETRLRDSMKMMGLSDFAYFFSYFVLYVILSLLLAMMATLTIKWNVFPYANFFFLFIFLFLFGVSIFPYTIIVCALFKRARTARIFGAFVFYFLFLGVFPFVMQWMGTLSAKIGGSFLPQVALALAIGVFSGAEGIQVGVQFDNIGDLANYEYKITYALIFFVVDFFYLLLLGLYLDNVVPGVGGIRKPLYYFLMPSYWGERKRSNRSNQEETKNMEETEDFERVTEDLRSLEASGEILKIRGLKKSFGGSPAVDGISMELYSGQIFALLGHNGAGKTTTIGLLTGLLNADAGTASAFGVELFEERSEARKLMGLCPQHEILYSELTVQESFFVFGTFKGMKPTEIREQSTRLMNDLQLREKRFTLTKNLSGGMKRKLSAGIALLGNPKLVMLDEPTSGMDATARREFWDMLKQYKQDKIIILTTHYMEEADYLGDRIAIMAFGKLRTCGTSLFLKNRFGIGYNLHLLKDSGRNSREIIEFVEGRVSEAEEQSDIGTEILIRLPFSAAGEFKELFKDLDEFGKNIGVESYGISVTTLEDVFLKVAMLEEGQKEKHEESTTRITAGITPGVTIKSEEEELLSHREDVSIFSVAEVPPAGFKIQSKALLYKRYKESKRSGTLLCFEFVLPLLLVLVGVITVIQSMSPRVHTYFIHDFPTPQRPIINSLSILDDVLSSNDVLGNFSNKYINSQYIPIQEHKVGNKNETLSTLVSFAEQIYDISWGGDEDIDPIRYGSYILFGSSEKGQVEEENTINTINTTTTTAAVYFNYSVPQSIIPFSNLLNTQIIRYLSGEDIKIEVGIQQMKVHGGLFATIMNTAVGSQFSSFCGLAFSFIPGLIAAYMVREKSLTLKHLQLTSGVTLITYWALNYIIEIILMLVPTTFVIILYIAFDLDLPQAWTILLSYPPALIAYTYILTFIFKNENSVFLIAFFLTLLLGFFGPMVIFIMSNFESTVDVSKALNYILSLLPPHACMYGLYMIAYRKVVSILISKMNNTKLVFLEPLDWDVAGQALTYLLLTPFLYFFILWLIEVYAKRYHTKKLRNQALPGYKYEYIRDSDVAKEEERIESSNPGEIPIYVQSISKSHDKKNLAICNVSFGVNLGEIFCLLGTNGAGKTTTFSTMTNQIIANRGAVRINNCDVVSRYSDIRRLIGFCPQERSLFDHLTVKEHFIYFCMIKGVPSRLWEAMTENIMKNLDLKEFKNTESHKLSGGNKRKLQVGIGLLGNPPIILLDEPSTGIDPKARRDMWAVISKISTVLKKSCVVLSTHSMEEAEALSSTIGILVNGTFRCFGSTQVIKNKFATGFELQIKIADLPATKVAASIAQFKYTQGYMLGKEGIEKLLVEIEAPELMEHIKDGKSGHDLQNIVNGRGNISIERALSYILTLKEESKIIAHISRNFEEKELIERHTSYLKIKIGKDERFSIGDIFAFVEEMKSQFEIAEYSVSQTTLDQIFNHFAKIGERELAVAD